VTLEQVSGQTIDGDSLMACYDVYDAIAAKWHRAPAPIPLQDFFNLLDTDGQAKADLLRVVDIAQASQPQEPVHRRVKREAETGWYKGEGHRPASRARMGGSPDAGGGASGFQTGAAGAAAATSSSPTTAEPARRQLAGQPAVSGGGGGDGGDGSSGGGGGGGMDAAAIEAIVKRTITEEVGALRVRVGQLEEEVLALKKQLAAAAAAAAPSPPR
jgi:hypothetical protein